MRKGTYSVFIGIIALIFIMGIIAFSSHRQQAQKNSSYNNTMLETKKITQNAVVLLDKIADDAIADSIFANNCTEVFDKLNPKGIKQTITAYFDTVKTSFPDCTIVLNSIIQSGIIIPGKTVYVADFSVQCTKSIAAEFSITYRENKVFQRNATERTTGPPTNRACTVDVFDGTASEFSKTGNLP